jgi:uncharacterized membrane protein
MGRDRGARLLLAILALVSLLTVLTGCGGGGGSSSSNNSSARITGVVEDQQTSAPIAGATVKAGGSSATTDGNGAFALSVPAGKLTVSITAPGYQSGSFSAVADQGQTNDIGVLTLLNADTNPPKPPV